MRSEPGHQKVSLITPNGRELAIEVEIADEPVERSQGLMFRESLPEGQGMLFVFEGLEPHSFWMKNTVIPLDILFFDADGNFVSAKTMDPCEEDPCPLYDSEQKAKYALEVRAGFVAEYSIGVGWRLKFEPV